MEQWLQIAFSIVGSTLAAYVGVRVAIAEMRRDIASLKEADAKVDDRVKRLEQPYFERGPVL